MCSVLFFFYPDNNYCALLCFSVPCFALLRPCPASPLFCFGFLLPLQAPSLAWVSCTTCPCPYTLPPQFSMHSYLFKVVSWPGSHTQQPDPIHEFLPPYHAFSPCKTTYLAWNPPIVMRTILLLTPLTCHPFRQVGECAMKQTDISSNIGYSKGSICLSTYQGYLRY